MQARPRFISTILAISATTFVVGCDESTVNEDPLASVAIEYRELLQDRRIVREEIGASDDTAQALRTLAGRSESAGREGDPAAASILTAGIRTSAASLDFDEALRFESQAAAMRDRVRAMAAAADLLATAADSAEKLDLGRTTILLESQLAESREAFNAADSELEELRAQVEFAQAQRDEHLADALQNEELAAEETAKANELGAIEAMEALPFAFHLREKAHFSRIAAAYDEISIQTIAPTMALADARRDGQSQIMEAANEARRGTRDRLDESRGFADDVRRQIDEMAATTLEALASVEAMESTEILPRLEAAIGDFDAAATAARALTRGGTREDATAGWRSIANAQFGAGRCQWEIATIHGRRADLFARLAAGGVLSDSNAATRAATEAESARKAALEAAESSFNDAIASLGNIQGEDLAATTTRTAIERAIDGVKGASMARPASIGGGGSMDGGFASGGSASSGTGFGTPTELANALSSMNPADSSRIAEATKAESEAARSLQRAFTGGDVMAPLMDAIKEQFPDFDPAAMAGEMPGMPSMGGASLPGFTVKSVEGDTATIAAANDSMKLIAVRTANGWMIDLDGSMNADPQLKMMAQMMGPMIEQMRKPMADAAQDMAGRVRAGEFASATEALEAFGELLADTMPSMGGGFGGGGF